MEEDRAFIHRSIFEELTKGLFTDDTRSRYVAIIGAMASAGAQGAIYGCTEIGLLLPTEQCPLPAFDTTAIHARAIVDFALEQELRTS
jgi:aspartate/glutamate racemase